MSDWYENAALMTLLGAVVGAIGGTVGSVIVTKMTMASAERQHLRELAYKAASEEYARTLDLAKHQGGVHLWPFYAFILHHLGIVNGIIFGKKENTSEVLKRLQLVKDQDDQLSAWIEARAKLPDNEGSNKPPQ